MEDRQNKALTDPFEYGPKPGTVGREMPNVTGGGVGDFDRKEFDRDLDRLFNP